MCALRIAEPRGAQADLLALEIIPTMCIGFMGSCVTCTPNGGNASSIADAMHEATASEPNFACAFGAERD